MGGRFKERITEERLSLILQRTYFAVLSLVLLAIVYFNVVGLLGTLPVSCSPCHKQSYDAWKASSHSGTGCSSCHGGADVFSAVSSRLSLARMVPAQLTMIYKRPVTAKVPSIKCLQCHSDVATKTVQNGLMRVSHKEIISAGYECDYCHSTVAHGKSTVRKNVPEMEKCLGCHNGSAASGACEKCHIKIDVVGQTDRIAGNWQTTHGPNWRKLHGMGNLATCQSCHSKLFCNRCHKTELPHSAGWLATHGKEIDGSAEAQKSCLQCHKGALCKNCHTMEMPHPKTFLSQHSKIVKKEGTKACYACHFKEACIKCHSFHIHPGIPQDKLKLLRESVNLD